MSCAIRTRLFACLVLLTCLAGPAAQDAGVEYAARMKEGDAALAAEQWSKALDAYRKANALGGKKSAEALAGQARAHYGMGAYKEAVDRWADALEHVAGDVKLEATCHNQRGMALFALAIKPTDKKVKEAEQEFRAALALDGSLAVARYNLALSLMRQSRDEEGAAEMTAFIAAAPGDAQVGSARRYLEMPRRAREPFAPDFSFVTLDERRLALGDLKGKVVVLDFWASWCGPCLSATPGLVNLQKKYGERAFALVGVSLDHDETQWKAYVRKNGMVWPQYWDREGRIARLFNIEPIPTYVVLDHDGVVRDAQSGWSRGTDRWLDSVVGRLLKAAEEAGAAR